MRTLSLFQTVLVFSLTTLWSLSAQERPVEERPPQDPQGAQRPREHQEQSPDESGEVGIEGEDAEMGRMSIDRPEAVNFQVFTNPSPLPQGGSGILYVRVDVMGDRFVTQGRRDTFIKPPKDMKLLKFGQVQWPEPTQNFLHPKSRGRVPGWQGNFFIKVPVDVAASAPLGEITVKLGCHWRVLLEKPPRFSIAHTDPLGIKVKIGPPLPNIQMPVRKKPTGAGAKKPTEKPEAGKKAPAANPGATPKQPTGPGKALAAESPINPPEPDDFSMDDRADSGFFSQPILVFGVVGLLVLAALLLIFSRRG